ncbi:hypothetical protein C7S18_24055 (plasmid) [Ahniella affigens]|uniref:Uncharacterized protein n=1 Tax=Ahniella affigens TaxID=2021234 RepID=A0A2P1PZX6_9GAMM|nr:hypothetical protein C7S18_24055 [Ahniella affigens]
MQTQIYTTLLRVNHAGVWTAICWLSDGRQTCGKGQCAVDALADSSRVRGLILDHQDLELELLRFARTKTEFQIGISGRIAALVVPPPAHLVSDHRNKPSTRKHCQHANGQCHQRPVERRQRRAPDHPSRKSVG